LLEKSRKWRTGITKRSLKDKVHPQSVAIHDVSVCPNPKNTLTKGKKGRENDERLAEDW
jgi:hypothetical protein